jgi:hypothetical protein
VRLKGGRAAAAKPHNDALRLQARSQQGEEGDDQAKANKERNPTDADGREVKLRAKVAIIVGRLGRLRVRGLGVGVFDQVRAKVKVLEQSRAKGKETHEQKDRRKAAHDRRLCARPPRKVKRD